MQVCYETIMILNSHEKTEIDEIAMLLSEQMAKFTSRIDIADLGEKRLAYPIRNHKKGHYIGLYYWGTEKRQDIVPIIENIFDNHPDVLKYLTIEHHEDLFTPEDTVKYFETEYAVVDWIKRHEQSSNPAPVIDAWDVIFGRATYPEE